MELAPSRSKQVDDVEKPGNPVIADREPARTAAAQASSEGGDEPLQQPPMPAEATLHRIGDDTVISSMTTDYTTIVHAGGTIIGGASEGTSTTIESSGGPFVEGGHSETTCVVYGKQSATGTELEAACTATTPEGDELYSISKRRAGDIAEGGRGAGELMLVGGTGGNAGITGSCTFEFD